MVSRRIEKERGDNLKMGSKKREGESLLRGEDHSSANWGLTESRVKKGECGGKEGR